MDTDYRSEALQHSVPLSVAALLIWRRENCFSTVSFIKAWLLAQWNVIVHSNFFLFNTVYTKGKCKNIGKKRGEAELPLSVIKEETTLRARIQTTVYNQNAM